MESIYFKRNCEIDSLMFPIAKMTFKYDWKSRKPILPTLSGMGLPLLVACLAGRLHCLPDAQQKPGNCLCWDDKSPNTQPKAIWLFGDIRQHLRTLLVVNQRRESWGGRECY